jgi:starch synthase
MKKATKVLFASSEMYPLIKTGGLADVSCSLPQALVQNGADVRVMLPCYQGIETQLENVSEIASLTGFALPDNGTLLEGTLPNSGLTVWLVNIPQYFDRPGNPYIAEDGNDHPDNCERFAAFSRAIAETARGASGLDWTPDIVHCNDWQTALVPAFLSFHNSPPVVFTIHNLAYQGVYPAEQFHTLALPDSWWSPDKLEYHGNLSLLKAGIICADVVTTVSPTYAREILKEEFGYGLDGLLIHNQDKLVGIINGIDETVWNPATDAFLEFPYNHKKITAKTKNKCALQAQLGLPVSKTIPLIGIVSRLAHQKGIDLVIEAIEALQHRQIQWVILGSGDTALEASLRALSKKLSDKVSLSLKYDEALAHRIEAGADFFVMPSRYEPCGLNQMYSLIYGAVPIVRNTGGLSDTVIPAVAGDSISSGKANGFVFDNDQADELVSALKFALKVYRNKGEYRALQQNGMLADFGWHRSARKYLTLYKKEIKLGLQTTKQKTPKQSEPA